MLPHNKRYLSFIIIVISLVAFTSCSSQFSKRKTPRSSSQFAALFKTSSSTNSSRRMDHVEFLINKDLNTHGSQPEGLDSYEFSELQSFFETAQRPWKPRRGYDLPIVRNKRVNLWINYFTGRLKPNFARWLHRASLYAPTIQAILREYRLPKDLLYLAMIESGFNMNAYSHAHAVGPWQFIGSTGRMYGLKTRGFVDERRDLIKATRAAARHLKDLHKQYGDWYLAFAAYNAGPGKVNRAIRKGRTKNYWKLTTSRSRLFRQETKDYVPKIIAAAIVAKNYRRYGFKSSLFQAPLNFELVRVPGATDVNVIAKSAGVSVKDIEFLNPALVLGTTPPKKRYEVMIPAGRSRTFYKNYARVPKNQRVGYVFHKVRKKETLYTVAKKYRMSRKKLAKLNRMSPRARLYRGSYLRVPKKGYKLKFENSIPVTQHHLAANKPAVQTRKTSKVTALSQRDNSLALKKTTAKQKSYRVRNGDTLMGISRKFGVSVRSLQRWNGLNAKGFIKKGQYLRVSPPIKRTTVVAKASSKPNVYKVRSGDSLGKIARKYGVSLASLQKWNRLNSKSTIRVGQTLHLAPPKSLQPRAPANASRIATNATYRVKQGDTLGLIARRFKMKLSDLRTANRLPSNGLIKVGQVLKVKNRSAVAQNRTIIHSVKKGETLWDLSKKYRVTIKQIKNWNSLRGNQIKPKQKLKINASKQAKSIAYRS